MDRSSLRDLSDAMKVVTVSGAYSRVGKTLLAEFLLSYLPDFAAIKITIDDFYTKVTDDELEIMQPGKDTFRLKQCGARKVVWVRTTEHLLAEALEQAFAMVSTFPRLLIEGNSVLQYVTPALAFFVVDERPLEEMKPNRFDTLKKADVCVINRKEGEKVNEENLRRIKSLKQQIKIMPLNLTNLSRYPYPDLQMFYEELELLR